jgi:two-component system NtrC family sensor kinase
VSESNEFTAAVMNAALDCIVAADAKGIIVEFNPASERTFGLSRAEAIGRSLAETIIPHHHRAAHEAGMARLAAGGTPRTVGRRIEIEGLRSNGEVFPLELAIVQTRGAGDALFVAYMRDITVQKVGEQRLRESEARLRLALEGAQLGSWSWDLKTGGAWWSPRCREIFGFPAEGEVPQALRDRLVHPDDRDAVSLAVRRVTEELGEAALEYRIVMPDGDIRWVATRGVGHRDAAGQPSIATGIVADITARKSAEAELERSREALHQAEKLSALGSLLAGVSHELNNPLSAVIGQAVMLEEDTAGTPFAQRAGKIRAAAERCAKIVQTFLAIARQGKPERSPVDVNQLVRAVLDLTEYGLRTSSVDVRLDLASDLPHVMADADQLHQVLANLVVNAQQAMEGQPGERCLEISTLWRAEANAVVLRVADNGHGVPKEIAGRIFDPFFTTKSTGRGTGVGLSYSLGIVEAHGGRLRLRPSEAGAVFEIEFAEQPAPVPKSEPIAAPLAATSGRALVVDDESTVSETLAELLARQGFEVITASDGQAAKLVLSSEPFDIILSDLRMPGLDGPGLFAWLQATRPDLCGRIGFVTGDTLGAAAARFLEQSGRPYLEKPFTPATVAAFVARLGASKAAA